jgi:chromosome segregation ATPase
VGADVDLSGVGKRKSEPDPFASSNEPPSPKTAKAHEQTKTHKTEQTQDHTFDKVGLTGEIAKDEGKGPGVINVSDEAAPTGSPKTEGAPTKEIALTTDDLKKARDAYQTARSKFLKTDPDWQKYLKLLGQMERLDGDSDTWKKASAKSYKLMRHAVDTFDKSDEGKKLLQDWMKTYEVVNKAGNNITDDMVPPDDLEQARHKLAKAQSTLKEEQDIYDTWKKQTVSENNGVKNIQAAIDELKKKTHFSEADAQADRDKLKQLQADLDKAKKQTEKDWAATDAARDQMKKVQQAEKELDKARSDFKPFEGLEKNPTKAASNP